MHDGADDEDDIDRTRDQTNPATTLQNICDPAGSLPDQPGYLDKINSITSVISQPDYLNKLNSITSLTNQSDYLNKVNSMTSLINQPDYLNKLNSITSLINQPDYLNKLNSITSLTNQPDYLNKLNSITSLTNQPGYFDKLNSVTSAINQLGYFDKLNSVTSAINQLGYFDKLNSVTSLVQAVRPSYLDLLTTATTTVGSLRPAYLKHFITTEPVLDDTVQETPPDFDVRTPISLPEIEPQADVVLRAFVELRSIETEIRAVIGFAMSERYGNDWFTGRVPTHLLNKWWRNRDAALKSGEEDAPLLYYADFGDYVDILAHHENWTTVFCTVFSDQDDVVASLRRLNKIRRPTMHSRNISEELLRILKVEIAQLRKSMERVMH